MKQPHYRLTFAKSTKNQQFDSYLNEMTCDAADFHKTFKEFSDSFLQGYHRSNVTDIGSDYNPCTRYIYTSDKDLDDCIFIYVYPPR